MSKKTETIEIRVSPELKAELAEKSRAEGKTMSGFLRERISEPVGDNLPKGDTLMTRTTKRIALATAPVLAVAAAYALIAPAAAIATPDIRMAFAEMDLNDDGVITPDEFRQMMMGYADDDMAVPDACMADFADAATGLSDDDITAELRELDRDGDGVITYEELHGQMIRESAEFFLMLDSNGDGYLSADELTAEFSHDPAGDEADELFSDEGLSPDCIAALDAEWSQEGDAWPEPSAAELAEEARISIAAMDRDHDGRVSLEEFLAQ